MNNSIRRYLFWISYDGSRFPEMAKGGTGFGVMDKLHQVVGESIFGRRSHWLDNARTRMKFSPSSRTDANVHAIRNCVIGQIPLEYAELDKTKEIKEKYLNKWNSMIEDVSAGSMRILDVHSVSAGFCVRRNISYRIYTYRLAVCKNWQIWDSIREDPSVACFSEKNYAWRLPPGFSPERCMEAAKLFEGEQVMGSFFKHSMREKRTDLNPPNALKYIYNVQLYPGEAYSYENDIYDYYNIKIVSKSFVREQIRRMMSCLVNHAYDRMPLDMIKWLLKNPISSNFYDRRIPISPPQGLFLTDVVYDPKMYTNPEPYHLHSWDYSL